MAEKQKNQIVVLEPVTKTVNELLEMITERDQAEIMPFMNSDEAVQCTRQFVPCMFVICIQSNSDIPNVLKVLKMLKPDIKQGLVKTLLVSKVKNPQLQKLIGEFGVTDYIEEPITARSLQFKANLQLRAVDNTRKQLELKKKADEKIVFKTSATNADDSAQTLNSDVKPRNKPALQLANDTFLLKASPVKKQAKKFVVELDGPDPSTGEWVSDGEDPATKNPNWRWKPNEKEDEPGADDGDGWVATGDKPQFKPANRKWQLSSEKPGLFYKKKNSKIAEKISTDENGEIAVAEDSPMAEENLRKNLAKVERAKKRKVAEVAGLPPPGEEPEEEVKEEKPVEEPEEEEAPNAILKALRKRKLAKKRGAEGTADEEPTEDPAEAEENSPARKKLAQLRRARKERAAKVANTDELVEEESKEPEAAVPEAEPEAAAETEPEAAAEGENSPIRVRKRKKNRRENPKANVLDFLQKKKEERKKETPAEEDSAEEPMVAETEPGEESSRTAELLKKARARRTKAKAAGLPEEEPTAEAEEIQAEEESLAEEEFRAEEERPVAEAEPEEESSSTAELLKKARERKRQRRERKRELLEEIETEEAAPEELEAIERTKKKREMGEVAEEEEEEESSASERLEKLRRKREELAALEREEEQEAQGEHLHAVQAEQLRGMNVWDTNEEAIAAEEEAKRLKKLKKDRAEQEETEKAKREDEDTDDFFAELAAEERESKKRKGAGADGLEEAFADSGADTPAAEADEPVSDSSADENPQESISDRLARLRKMRDARQSARETSTSENELTAQDEKTEGEALLSSTDPEKKEDKASTAEAAADEDLGATTERKEEREEIPLDLSKPEKPAAAPVSAEDLLAKKSKTSESMRKFLERRKQKKEAERVEDIASGAKPKMIGEAVAAPDGKRSFLAIFVAVSDSFGVASDKKMTNILRALEGSFASCTAFLAEPLAGPRFKVILGNSVEAGAELPTENSHVEDISAGGQVIAHLVIRMSEPRTELAKDEAEAVQRAMLTLRPLASQWLLARGEKAA